MDFDVSAVLFDGTGTVVDAAYFNKISAANGKVMHSGDETSGHSNGDNESITINLKTMDQSITCIAIVVSAATFNAESRF